MEPSNTYPKLYSPPVTVGFALVLFLVTQFIAASILTVVPLLIGWSEARTSAWLTDSPWAQFVFVLLVETITLYMLWQLLKRRHATFRTIGLKNPQLVHIAYAVGGFIAYFILYIVGLSVIKTLIPALDLEQKQELGFSSSAGGIELVLVFISLVILPPIVEEIVARGFIYTSLRNKLPVVSAAVITSILFAAAHLGGASDGLLWVAAIDTFILSMVMCYLREKTGSLWSSIGVHFIKNGLAFVVLFNITQYFR